MAGDKAPLSVEEGAVTPSFVVNYEGEESGKF